MGASEGWDPVAHDRGGVALALLAVGRHEELVVDPGPQTVDLAAARVVGQDRLFRLDAAVVRPVRFVP